MYFTHEPALTKYVNQIYNLGQSVDKEKQASN